jgi:eukaryotic-like serine/threonine-protein kinase
MTPGADPRIDGVLDAMIEGDLTPEEACADHPDLLDAVRERWRRARDIDLASEAMFPAPSRDDATQARATHGPLPRIDGYEFLSLLGSGGMGVVHKARHRRLDRIVAVKMVALGRRATPAEAACLEREALAVARLQHPNIVRVYEVGAVDGQPYFSMEYVDGGSLAEAIAGVPQPPDASARLVCILAEAVAVAHASGVVHRDLKPANVLLTLDGTPKIADFSLARRVDMPSGLTERESRVGTPSYMAPEQVTGEGDATGPGVDIYALGALLYELLTGRPPFRAETHAETLRQVVERQPAVPSSLNARVPRDLETICLTALAKEPTRRYPSALALAADLKRHLRGEPIAARRAGPLERLMRWARRKPAHATLAGMGALIAAASIAGATWYGATVRANGRAIADGLRIVDSAAVAGAWDEARRALDLVLARQAATPDASFADPIAKRERDLRTVTELAAVRMQRTLAITGDFDPKASADRYAEILRTAGLVETGDDPDRIAARIAASPIRAAIVEALDDWVLCSRDRPHISWLMAINRRSDPDPAWRDRLRTPTRWTDREHLRSLAADADVAREPVPLLFLLANLLADVGDDPIPFLSRVQRARPSDFWVNFLLGEMHQARGHADAVAFYRAAVALRPESVGAHVNLGIALQDLGRTSEAEAEWMVALDLAPDTALVHFSLATAAFADRRFEDAAARASEAIRLDPDTHHGHALLGSALVRLGRFEEAIAALRTALERTAADDPLRPSMERDLASALSASPPA